MTDQSAFWGCEPAQLFEQTASSPEGLRSEAAEPRVEKGMAKRPAWLSTLLLLLSQFKSPLVLILVFPVVLSASLGETSNAVIILTLLLLTGLLIRTTRPAWRSLPGRYLLAASLAVGALGIALPYLPLAPLTGLVPLPQPLLAGMVSIALLYAVIVEFTKTWFFKKAAI